MPRKKRNNDLMTDGLAVLTAAVPSTSPLLLPPTHAPAGTWVKITGTRHKSRTIQFVFNDAVYTAIAPLAVLRRPTSTDENVADPSVLVRLS